MKVSDEIKQRTRRLATGILETVVITVAMAVACWWLGILGGR